MIVIKYAKEKHKLDIVCKGEVTWSNIADGTLYFIGSAFM
jgi:hypothetical protein